MPVQRIIRIVNTLQCRIKCVLLIVFRRKRTSRRGCFAGKLSDQLLSRFDCIIVRALLIFISIPVLVVSANTVSTCNGIFKRLRINAIKRFTCFFKLLKCVVYLFLRSSFLLGSARSRVWFLLICVIVISRL